MNQSRISNLVSKLNYKIQPKARRLKNVNGSEGRIFKLQKTLTALLKYERIELNYNRADETRGYIEQLISKVMQNGCNKNTMELADFWILEKQLIHKLFNVLPSRYHGSTIYTNVYHSPRTFPGIYYRRAVIELKGNPFPSIATNSTDGGLLIQNLLLNQARKEYSSQQYEKTIENITHK